jgi:hypothetical protein
VQSAVARDIAKVNERSAAGGQSSPLELELVSAEHGLLRSLPMGCGAQSSLFLLLGGHDTAQHLVRGCEREKRCKHGLEKALRVAQRRRQRGGGCGYRCLCAASEEGSSLRLNLSVEDRHPYIAVVAAADGRRALCWRDVAPLLGCCLDGNVIHSVARSHTHEFTSTSDCEWTCFFSRHTGVFPPPPGRMQSIHNKK